VARAERRTDSGARRSATYTLRVPVGQFQPLVDGLAALGHAERNALDSQDVTEEYYDVNARLKNLKEQEANLTQMQRDRQKEKFEDFLKIGDRIREIRLEIDRVEGRLKYLSTMTALSTVHLTLKEIKDYKPPTAPTFGDRATRTLGGSWEALVRFGEGVALAAVALVPWLPVLVPVGLVGVVLIRRAKRAQPAPNPELVRRDPPADGGSG
jgi:hypothetical protein